MPPPAPQQRPPIRSASAQKPSTARRAFFILLLLLAVILSLGLATITYVVLNRPESIGLARITDLQQTDTAVASTLGALQATRSAFDGLSTQVQSQFQNLSATQAALQSGQDALRATQTQSIVQALMTQTAVVAANQQQATQSAINRAATQTAIANLAAQAERDFQATQTALAGGLPMAMPTGAPNIILIDQGFNNLSETSQWSGLPPTTTWAQQGSDALVALVDAATLLARGSTRPDYTLRASLTPPTDSVTDLLMGVNMDNATAPAYGIRITTRGGIVTSVEVFSFTAPMLGDAGGLRYSDALGTRDGLNINATALLAEVQVVSGGMTTIRLNGQTILLFTGTLPAGHVGIQAARGTQVYRLTVD